LKQKIEQALPAGVTHLLRNAREYIYLALNPIDYLMRLMNDKTDFPPIALRRYVGTLRNFESSGMEYAVYLKLLCGLKPDNERMLDIGCGCGLIALNLIEHHSFTGQYLGVDIHQPSIQWCRGTISRSYPNFTFAHIDVKNQMYNPNGAALAETFEFPFPDKSFDFILLKSVFTHLRPEELDNYLKEIARLLSERGRCLATFFLLNPAQEALAKAGKNKLNFQYGGELWRYAYKNTPEAAIAYQETSLKDMLRRRRLSVKSLYYGVWSGLKEGVSYQDMILIEPTG
jgi:ubiquinone/menaquinone biosynthesis C-methylase UbiE